MPNWKITNLKRLASATDGSDVTKQNVVHQVEAHYLDDNGEVLDKASVALSLSNFSSFAEYDALSEADCIAWLRNALTQTGQLSQIETPPTPSSEGGMLDGTPW